MAARKSKTAEPEPLVGSGLGRVAYEAYSAAVSLPGKTAARPTWGELTEDHHTAAAWCAAAQAVIAATIERTPSHGSA